MKSPCANTGDFWINIQGEQIMNDLIRIVNTKISDAEIKTVNARELHVFLDSGQEFANWIKSRIADFGFIDGQDFLTILSKTPNGGRPSREYYISLGMMKLAQKLEIAV